MKKILAIILAVVMLVPFVAYAKTSNEIITFNQSINLIKGDHEYVTISDVDEDTKVYIGSTDKKIATVNKEGKISAKKCGVATVTLKIVKNNTRCQTKIKVNVTKSKNAIKKVRGEKAETVKKANVRPVTMLPVAVKVGEYTSFTTSNLEKDDEVTYASTNEGVATVDQEGLITAKKTGDAIITACVTRDGKKFRCKEKVYVVKSLSKNTITTKERNKYYSTSAFIGSSIGVGQKYYFDSQGQNYLGHPLMLVRGCYSFNNDKNHYTKYMVQYKGVSMRAKDAVRKSGVDKVFIAMGTNDLFQGVDTTYKQYVDYIEGIKKESPKVIIFIESMTSVHASSQKKQLNSRNVAKLNAKLKEYSKTKKDVYYVDVSSRLNDSRGNLQSKYASDNYVHLTHSAYAIWMEELTEYTDKLMIAEQNAKDAVDTAVESKNSKQIQIAKKKVNKLDSSSFKNDLNKKLNAIK